MPLADVPFAVLQYMPSIVHGDWTWKVHPHCETYVTSIALLDTLKRWLRSTFGDGMREVAMNGLLTPTELHVSPCNKVFLAHASSGYAPVEATSTWTETGALPLLATTPCA